MTTPTACRWKIDPPNGETSKGVCQHRHVKEFRNAFTGDLLVRTLKKCASCGEKRPRSTRYFRFYQGKWDDDCQSCKEAI